MKIQKKEKKHVDVLVVDDEPSLQMLLSAILEAEHLSHNIASSGKEAFKLAMENSYSLILMDLNMAGWDGLTAIRSLDFVQEIEKIIVISAYLDEARIEEIKKEPLVVGWLKKPFDPMELVEMIRNVMRK